MTPEEKAIADFEAHLDGVSHMEFGKPVTRRRTWSIERIQFARQVWLDSRTGLVVTLPRVIDRNASGMKQRAYAIDECQECVISAGIKCEIKP